MFLESQIGKQGSNPNIAFQYCQLRNLMCSSCKLCEVFGSLTPFKRLLNSPSIQKGLLSKIYAMLISKDETNNKIRHKWEVVIKEPIFKNWLEPYDAMGSIIFTKLNSAIKERVYRYTLCCWYLTLQHLSKRFPGMVDQPWTYGERGSTVSHMVELH